MRSLTTALFITSPHVSHFLKIRIQRHFLKKFLIYSLVRCRCWETSSCQMFGAIWSQRRQVRLNNLYELSFYNRQYFFGSPTGFRDSRSLGQGLISCSNFDIFSLFF